MKKQIAITLCLVMLISVLFSGCGGSESIVGTWNATVDMSNFLNESIAAADESMAEYLNFTDIKLDLAMTFKEDGTYTISFDQTSIEAMMETLMDQMLPAMDTMMQETMGMSLDDLLTLSGMTEDEMLSTMMASMQESMDMSELNMEGNYIIQNGVLYSTDSLSVPADTNSEAIPYTLSGNTLTLESGDSDGDMAFLFPLVLKKAA